MPWKGFSMAITQLSASLFRLDVRFSLECREHRVRETFKGNRKLAEERYHDILRGMKARAARQPRSLTIDSFGDALEWYFRVKKDNLVSATSFKRMQADLGGVRLREIGQKFKMYWLALRRTKSCQTGEFLSASTINHYTIMAKAASNMCVKDGGLLETNPLRHVEILKMTPRDIYLSELDRQRLLNVIDRKLCTSAIVRFAFAVPCRKAELVSLRREDIRIS